MKIIAILQCRMNSSRFPGKVLKEIEGLPILVHIYRRLASIKEVDSVVVAPGPDGDIERIVDACFKYGMNHRRPLKAKTDEDLLTRFKDHWQMQPFDAFLRVRADCLFTDPAVLSSLVHKYIREYPRYRAISNWPNRFYSEGLDAEIWSSSLLMELDATKECPREDFATWAWNHGMVDSASDAVRSGMWPKEPHLSIDTPEDFSIAEKMMAILGPNEWRYEKTLEAYRKVMAEE